MPRITCVGKLPNGRFPLLNQESLKTVQVLGFDDAFQIEPVLPVFLHLHAAPLPHGGGQAQLIIRQQHPDGVHPVTEQLVQLFQQGIQTVAVLALVNMMSGSKFRALGLSHLL